MLGLGRKESSEVLGDPLGGGLARWLFILVSVVEMGRISGGSTKGKERTREGERRHTLMPCARPLAVSRPPFHRGSRRVVRRRGGRLL